MANDFLIELGCEDLPAGQIDALVNALAKGFSTQLKTYGLEFGEVQLFGTPRRLAVRINDLASETAAQTIERRGPAKVQAFDNEGNPTKALAGFLQSANAKVEDLIEVATDKGTWLAVKVHKPAQQVKNLLPIILSDVIKSLPMKRSMRWGDHAFSFLRPVHWLVMLYGKDVVDAEVFGVKSDRITYGHRFLQPGAIKITQPKEYEKKLLKAYVMASREERKLAIEEQAKTLADIGNQVRFNTLNEVVNLVEWPEAVLCEFKADFLKVPKEVLISAMETHQRVFPILDKEGKLKAEFIAISNNATKDVSEIKLGNEKVIYARLSDAAFFYMSDAKTPLLNRLDDLKKISFQEKLGSLFDKVERVEALSEYLAQQVGTSAEQVKMAARLCKCDLTTDMVQEFPELQGIMGREYALQQSVPQDICDAIEDHYKPKVRDGELPRNQIGAVLALADKLDTLVGLFGIGEKPTGSGDPYALRRQALGVIAILMQFDWSLDLVQVISKNQEEFARQRFKLTQLNQNHDLIEFFLERMGQWCVDEHPEISTNVVNAVKSKISKDIVNRGQRLNLLEFFDNAKDLNKILKTSAGQELLQLVKRATNIVPDRMSLADYSHLQESAELALIAAYEKITTEIHIYKEQKQFLKAYTLLLDLKAPLARFFDEVMVMVDDQVLKQERLSLLHRIMQLFYLLADFKCL